MSDINRYGPRAILEQKDGSLLVRLPVPAAPIAQAATNIGVNKFDANWTVVDPNFEATGFAITVSTSPTLSPAVTGYDHKAVGMNLKFTVTGLNSSTQYYYGIQAFAGGGLSAMSNVVTLSTQLVDTLGYCFPGQANKYITIGDLVDINAMQKLTTIAFVRPDAVVGGFTFFSRWADDFPNSLRDQYLLAIQNTKILVGMWAAPARAFYTGDFVYTAGKRYKISVVFDGSQATNATKMKVYHALANTDGSYPADVLETGTFTGNNFPTFVGAGLSLNARIGGAEANISPFLGAIAEVRVFFNRALTPTELAAQLPGQLPIVPELYYPFNVDALNHGAWADPHVPSYNGVVAAGVTLCTV